MIIATDLEGTLTTGETWRGIGKYLAQHGRAMTYRTFFLTHLPGALLSKLGLISKQRFRDRWIADLPRLLRGYTVAQWNDVAEWVVEHELWPQRRVTLIDEIMSHRQDGYRLVLVSGTYQPVLDAFARRLDAEAVGTPLELANDRATGRLAGAINNAEAKAGRLRAFLAGSLPDIAYGDTAADLPMLGLSKIPVAVYPDAQLRKAASKGGWRIIETHGEKLLQPSAGWCGLTNWLYRARLLTWHHQERTTVRLYRTIASPRLIGIPGIIRSERRFAPICRTNN